ncbi:MAG: hydrogenase nickel incorporation protein HypB [Rhodospirillales bacterium]|nr:hydrogenase nickel incorporation protein HypB [Rhodospirillales bacterium]
MCGVCGCAVRPAESEGHASAHDHGHAHTHVHHVHGHQTDDPHTHSVSHARPGGVDDHGMRLVRVEQDILAANDAIAAANRRAFGERGVVALNLMSAPGSGKTTLLVRTIEDLKASRPIAVIEGDQETSFDAERIRATGVAAHQINTGKGCHLDARMVASALAHVDFASALAHVDLAGTLAREDGQAGIVFIENVGNLVCPAAFDLGEASRVVLLSVTEGDDKPLKYAGMFAAADLLLITKIDLLPFVPFDLDRCCGFARRVNPAIEIIEVSATRGDGLDRWYAWIAGHCVGAHGHAGLSPPEATAVATAAARQTAVE